MASKTNKDDKAPKLEIVAGKRAGETVPLGKGNFVIGSDEAATLNLADAEVEWSHARIYKQRSRFFIEDLQSQGGIFVNDKKVGHSALASGDVIGIGAARFRFSWNGAGAKGATAEMTATEFDTSEAPAGVPGQDPDSVEAFVARVVADVQSGAEPGETGPEGPVKISSRSDAVILEGPRETPPPPTADEIAASFTDDAAPAGGDGEGDASAAPPHPQAARTEMIEVPAELSAPDAAPAAEHAQAEHAQAEHAQAEAAADHASAAPAQHADASTETVAESVAAATTSLDAALAQMEEARRLVQSEPAEPLAPPAPELPPEPTAAQLSAALAILHEQNSELQHRISTAEGELQRKREGLSLATESFVDQLERAKERINSFAKRHAETEALVRAREEELEKLRSAHGALEQMSAAKQRDLIDRLEAVRRDFDDIARLAALKGQNLARILSEAKVAHTHAPQQSQMNPAGQQAAGSSAMVPAGVGPNGLLSADDLTASRSGSGARAPGAGPGTAPRPSRATITALSTSTAGTSLQAASAATTFTPEPGRLDPLLAPMRRLLGSEWLSLAAIFLIIAGAAFLLIYLVQAQPDRGKVRLAAPAVPAPGAPTPSFPPAKPAEKTTQVTPKTAPPAKPPPSTQPTSQAPPVSPAPQVVAEVTGDDEAGLLGPLRRAHRTRDEKAIHEAEQALVQKGKDILPAVQEAAKTERQFNIKVSLDFIARALEGKDSARDIVDAMKTTKDPGEKMRLAFMLGKLNKPSDIPFLEEAAQNEQDPMIKKYIVRALGNVEGPRGMQVLVGVAENSQDRNLRIEAIRALEEKASPEAVPALTNLARNEQDASIKSIAIRSLANVGGRESMTFFNGILEQDERTNNRAEAAKYMGRIGEPSDVQALESVYQRERVYYIRQKLRQAIDQINRRAGIEVTTPPAEPAPVGTEDANQPPR